MHTASSRLSGISTYSLYSEAPSLKDPEFFHIEDIKSRARLFNWNIGIHSHPRMFQLVYVHSGAVRAHLDGQEHAFEGPCLLPFLHRSHMALSSSMMLQPVL